MKIKSVLSGLPLLALLACNNGLNDPSLENKTKKVSFTSTISNNYNTRAIDASWETNDKIGVYMLKSSDKQIINSNISYVTAKGNGDFTASSMGLYYPEDESYVDFIAYYPYQQTISTTYKINVSNQSKPQEIDLMYSKNLTERNSQSAKGCLQFYHQLSRLNLQFNSIDNTDITSIKATIKGVPTQGEFNLTNGKLLVNEGSKGDINMYHSGSVAQAILLPSENVKGIKILLTLEGNTKEVTLPETITSFEAGTNYSININVKNGSSVIVPDDASYTKWRETPVISKEMLERKNIKYISHYMPNDKTVRNFSLLYDENLKMAYWVAYPYCSYYGGKAGRTDNWAFDPSIDAKYQADYALGGFGSSYDRGHQIPSGDRQRDKECNYATFYSTNITPQIGRRLNQSIWAELENKVRGWSQGTDTIFVVTGASATTPTDKNVKYVTHRNGVKVAVPKYYYKALARKVEGQFRTIAFKLDQKEYNDKDFMKCAISVAELEKITGFTFFPSIDVNVKKNMDTKYWN